MPDRLFHSDADPDDGEAGMFLELGINRLARDLFLLTAVCALFLVMFMSAPLRIVAERSWSEEARLVEQGGISQGIVLSLHLRRDGRIEVGDRLVSRPDEVTPVVRGLIRETPGLRDAKVVINTYHQTPSIVTSDLTRALAGAGLEPQRFYLRFTQQ